VQYSAVQCVNAGICSTIIIIIITITAREKACECLYIHAHVLTRSSLSDSVSPYSASSSVESWNDSGADLWSRGRFRSMLCNAQSWSECFFLRARPFLLPALLALLTLVVMLVLLVMLLLLVLTPSWAPLLLPSTCWRG
jgi:hypothetical protein